MSFMKNNNKRIVTILVCISIVSLLVACDKKKEGTPAKESISVRLTWLHQAQFAGFYIAKEKGWYSELGLDASLNPGGVEYSSIKMVPSGTDDFGVTSADQLLLAREKGIPVVAIAAMYQKSPAVFIALESSGIKKPEDFIGRRIGIKYGDNTEIPYRAMIRKLGISKENITEVSVGYDVTPLLAGKVDAIAGFVINEPISIKQKGYEINLIAPSDYGVNMYAEVIFTTEAMIKDNPEIVQKFLTATLRGYDYMIKHPDEGVSATLKRTDMLSREHQLSMIEVSIPLISVEGTKMGSMEKEIWVETQNILLEQELMKKPIDIEKSFTTGFQEKAVQELGL